MSFFAFMICNWAVSPAAFTSAKLYDLGGKWFDTPF